MSSRRRTKGAEDSTRRGVSPARPLAEVGSLLASRLRDRLPEIHATITTRVYAISDPEAVDDLAYREGLDAAVAAAVEYRLSVLARGERSAPPVPVVLLAQARLDARDGVSLDTVLRRYFAGNALFSDFIVKEAQRAEIPSSALPSLLGAQATLGDHLLAEVSAEHSRESANRPTGVDERRRKCANALLAGKLVESSDLDYELEVNHLGLLLKGQEAPEAASALAERLDRRLLVVTREEEPTSACWLGGRLALDPVKVSEALGEIPQISGGRVVAAIGEPGDGLPGWRRTHRQAKAALPLLESAASSVVRYADVVLLATILRDDLALTSLRQRYLQPLAEGRDDGAVARGTLRAYFAAERNVSSTAAALGVNRRTVTSRLRAIEDRLGRPIGAMATELETALRLDDMQALP